MSNKKHTIGTCLHEEWCTDFDLMVDETDKSVSDAVAAGILLWMKLTPEERLDAIAIARNLRKNLTMYRGFMAKTPTERVDALCAPGAVPGE